MRALYRIAVIAVTLAVVGFALGMSVTAHRGHSPFDAEPESVVEQMAKAERGLVVSGTGIGNRNVLRFQLEANGESATPGGVDEREE